MQYLQLFNNGHFPPRFNKYFLAQTLKTDIGAIYCLKWSLDGKYLAAASANGSIIVWKVVLSSNERAEIDPEGCHIFKQEPIAVFKHESTVNSIDWSPNGFILSSSEDLTVKLWHVDRNDCLHTYKFSGIVTNAKFLKSDDRFFIASLWDGNIYFFSILEKSIVFEKSLDIQITSFDITVVKNNNTHIIVGGDRGWIYVLDLMKSFDILASYQIKDKSHHFPRVTGIECFYDNHSPSSINSKHQKILTKMDVKLLVSTNDSRIRLINYSSKCLEVRYSGAENKSSSIKAHINDNKSYILSGSEDGWVYIWDTYNGFKRRAGHLNFPDLEDSKESQSKISKLFKPLTNVQIPNLPFGDDAAQVRNKHYASWHLFQKTNIAVWGPRATSKLLELSDDPIWEMYTAGRHVQKISKGEHGGEETVADPILDELFGCSLIVAADSTGSIKVLRLDFAYEFRKMLSKKIKSKKYSKNGLGGTNNGSSNGSSNGGDEISSGALDRTKSMLISSMSGRTRADSQITNSTLETQDNDLSHNIGAMSIQSVLSSNNNDDIMDTPRTGLSLFVNNDELSSSLLNPNKLGPDEQLRRRKMLQQRDSLLNKNNIITEIENDDVDGELYKLMAQHKSNTASPLPTLKEKKRPESDPLECKRCGSSQFTAKPITASGTNEISFFCKNCGDIQVE